MEYCIRSKKLRKTIKFWSEGNPYSYIYCNIDSQEGYLGHQLCKKASDGHMAALELSGKTEKEREYQFRRICQNWYRNLIKQL